MVLVMKRPGAIEGRGEYYGVNVLFMPNGEVEASTADPIADQQWEEDRKKIIEVARKFVGADTIKAFVERGGDADNHGDHKFEELRAVKEAVYTLRDPNIKKRGAPDDKARAFDKPGTDRSVLRGLQGKGKYIGLEFADEDEFISVIVVRDDMDLTYGSRKRDPNDEYNGINVLFFPDGKIDADTYDVQSKRQWIKDKDKIIAAAKAALKDENLPGQYDGLGGVSVKRGTDKLSFDVDDHVLRDDPKTIKHWSDEKHRARKYEAKLSFKNFMLNEGKGGPFGVKIGGISTEKPEVGFEDRLNYEKAKSECKDAGIPFKSTSKFGVHYITFNNEADQKKAVKLIKKVIDKSVESEW